MRFSAAHKSVFGTFVVGLVVVCVFEAPILHVVLHRAPWWVHLLVAALNLSTIGWLLVEKRRTRDAGYDVGVDGLDVGIGTRWSGRIAWRDVASARVMATRSLAEGGRRGVLRVTPIDAPNVELVGRVPLTLRTSFGRRRAAPRVHLYVDDPEAFVGAVNANLTP